MDQVLVGGRKKRREAHLELSAVGDGDGGLGLSRVRSVGLDGLDEVHSLDDLSEDDVLTVQPGSLDGGDEELRSVGVLSGVGHGQKAGLSVLELEVLISELLAVDGLTTSSVTLGEVSSLEHEVGDHTVEDGSLEVEGLSGLSGSLLTSAESAEVLGSEGDDVSEELEDDAASSLSLDGDIEEDLGVGRHG